MRWCRQRHVSDLGVQFRDMEIAQLEKRIEQLSAENARLDSRAVRLEVELAVERRRSREGQPSTDRPKPATPPPGASGVSSGPDGRR